MRLALARAALLDDVGLRGGQPTVRRDGLAAVTRGRPGAEADLLDVLVVAPQRFRRNTFTTVLA